MTYFQCCPSSWFFFKHVVSETESVSIIRCKGCRLTGPLKWHDLRILAHMNGNLYVSLGKQIQYLKCCVWKKTRRCWSVSKMRVVFTDFFPFDLRYFLWSENVVVRYILCCCALEIVVIHIFHSVHYNLITIQRLLDQLFPDVSLLF